MKPLTIIRKNREKRRKKGRWSKGERRDREGGKGREGGNK